MPAFDYLSNKVTDHSFNDGTWAQVTAPHLALLPNAPTRSQTGSTITEVTYGGYARLAVNPADWSAGGTGDKTNTAAISFAAGTSGTGSARYLALVDASSGGNALMYAPIVGTNTFKDVTTITRASTTATVTCPSHGLATNDEVDISGATQAEYNGNFTVTVVDANTFTYTVTGTPATPATSPFGAIRAVKLSPAPVGLNATPNIAIGAVTFSMR